MDYFVIVIQTLFEILSFKITILGYPMDLFSLGIVFGFLSIIIWIIVKLTD